MKTYRARRQISEIDAGPQAPEWILLFALGWNELHGEGKYMVDEESFRLVSEQFARRGNDVVVDYEHQTLEGIQAPAAGWIKELTWDPDHGIMARVEWTERGAGYVVKREYRYFSPVFYVRESDKRLVALDSVALTNSPKHNHLTPILAKMSGDCSAEPDTEGAMEFLQKLAAKLDLGADATEEKVLEKVASLAEPQIKEVIPAEVLSALGMESGEAREVVATIHAVKQQGRGMVSREEFNRLQNQLLDRDVKEVVAKAMSDGKISPDQKDWAEGYARSDMEGFKTFVAKAPVVIPTGKLPGKSSEKADPAADSAVLAVAKQMGIDVEDIKKYGGLE